MGTGGSARGVQALAAGVAELPGQQAGGQGGRGEVVQHAGQDAVVLAGGAAAAGGSGAGQVEAEECLPGRAAPARPGLARRWLALTTPCNCKERRRAKPSRAGYQRGLREECY